jgi:hypothetical protein
MTARNPNALDPAVARAIAPIRAARLESKRREGHGKPPGPSRRMSAHRFDVVTMAEGLSSDDRARYSVDRPFDRWDAKDWGVIE